MKNPQAPLYRYSEVYTPDEWAADFSELNESADVSSSLEEAVSVFRPIFESRHPHIAPREGVLIRLVYSYWYLRENRKELNEGGALVDGASQSLVSQELIDSLYRIFMGSDPKKAFETPVSIVLKCVAEERNEC
jgi:hypothetical protein